MSSIEVFMQTAILLVAQACLDGSVSPPIYTYGRAEVNTISSWSLIWDQPASAPVRYSISCHARSYLIMSHKLLVVPGEVKTTEYLFILYA